DAQGPGVRDAGVRVSVGGVEVVDEIEDARPAEPVGPHVAAEAVVEIRGRQERVVGGEDAEEAARVELAQGNGVEAAQLPQQQPGDAKAGEYEKARDPQDPGDGVDAEVIDDDDED